MAKTAFDGGFSSLSDFVLNAVQLGALGFGAVLFVMVFLILIRNQAPPDPSTARLRTAFLYMGTAAFLVACAVQLITLYATPKPTGAYRMSVAFAPELDVAK